MRYFSTFSGIGGFELGIQQAYELRNANRNKDGRVEEDPAGNQRPGLLASPGQGAGATQRSDRAGSDHGADPRPLCIGYSEVDKYAIEIYQKHFDHKNYGDIKKIAADSLPDFELFVGGFPCQSFSLAGKRAGFNDTRGTLFFEIARILKAKQPRNFLLENVKGLLSHDGGRTFKTIIATLTELGYDLQWQVLNSKDFGVPQNRERIFIIGHLRGTARPQVFPITETDEENSFTNDRGGGRHYKIFPAIRASGHKRGDNDTLIRRDSANSQGRARLQGNEVGSLPNDTGPGEGRRIEPASDLDEPQIRRLTPKECERLQGFPDDWTASVSDTQRYKTIGNAVTVNVIQSIMEKLLWP